MSLKVVKLEEKYIKKVAEIESRLIKPVSEQLVANTLESDNCHYLVLTDNDEVYGFLQYLMIVPETELYEIAIDEKFQGRGYSKILMDYYIDLAKKNNCDTIFLEVNIINKKAISLYNRFGFTEYGRRKNYYGENQDAILMKLMI